MGWEYRRGRRYYYRSVRTPAGSRKVYLGSGRAAREAAAEAEAAAADRAAGRAAAVRFAAADRSTALLRAWARASVAAALVAAGFYYRRGEWRLTVSHPTPPPPSPGSPPAGVPTASPRPTPPPELATRDELIAELNRLERAVKAGEAGAVDRIREVLAARPTLRRHLGEAAAHAQGAWVAALSGGKAVPAEALTQELATWKADLLGPDSTPADRAVVDLLGVAWLEAHTLSVQASEEDGAAGAVIGRRAEAAQRKVVELIASLERLRTARAAGAPRAPRLKVFTG